MKKIIAFIHNFFHTFKKDKGAHFAYNLGVGLVRTGMLLVAIGLAVFVVSRSLNSFRLIYVEEVKAFVKVERIPSEPDDQIQYNDTFIAHFDCTGSNGSQFHVDEIITYEMYNSFLEYSAVRMPQHYQLYKVVFNKRPDEELYVTEQSKTNTMLEYAQCHEETLPLSLAGMWVLFVVSLLMFIMGRKQMSLGLKYPRNDVPEVIAGVPEVVPEGERENREKTDEKVRRDISEGTLNALPLTETENE